MWAHHEFTLTRTVLHRDRQWSHPLGSSVALMTMTGSSSGGYAGNPDGDLIICGDIKLDPRCRKGFGI